MKYDWFQVTLVGSNEPTFCLARFFGEWMGTFVCFTCYQLEYLTL